MRLLARDQCRTATEEAVIHDVVDACAVENEIPQKRYRLHGRVERAFCGTRIEEDAFVFRSSERMRAEPSEDDEFVLRQVILSSDDRLILHPNQQLREIYLAFIKRSLERKQHLVAVEDVDAVFLRHVRKDILDPPRHEFLILRFIRNIVVQDFLVDLHARKVFFALSVGYSVWHIGEDAIDLVRADKLLHAFGIKRIADKQPVSAELPDLTLLN